MPHDGIRFELIDAVGQIFPHQIFGEGEDAQGKILDDFESRDVPHGPTDRRPDCAHIDALVVDGQLTLQLRDGELEVLPQKLQQSQVEPGFVLMRRQDDARARALALEGDRQKNKGSSISARIALGALPVQKPHGQEQRVGPALLHIQTGLAVEFDKLRVERLIIEGR